MADFLDAKIIFADTVDTVHAVVAGSAVAVELFSVSDGVVVNSAMLLSFLTQDLSSSSFPKLRQKIKDVIVTNWMHVPID